MALIQLILPAQVSNYGIPVVTIRLPMFYVAVLEWLQLEQTKNKITHPRRKDLIHKSITETKVQ